MKKVLAILLCLLMLTAFVLLQVKLRGKKLNPILVMALCGLCGVALHALGWM